MKHLNELVAFKEYGINMQTSNFIDFVIKAYEEIEVYLAEFGLENLGKSYCIQENIVRSWRM